MVKLSLNVNKIATLRNSRGENFPNVVQVVLNLISWGATSITVHPRPDERHILFKDVREIAKLIHKSNANSYVRVSNISYNLKNNIELNVEGYPSKSFLDLIVETKPHQCTLVPDPPEVLTSNQGWNIFKNLNLLKDALSLFRSKKIRSSLFINPLKFNEHKKLFQLKPDRVEFYTGDYAKAFKNNRKEASKILEIYSDCAKKIIAGEIEINAGHDLNQENLSSLIQYIPQIKEISIGHAFICESLFLGLKPMLEKYENLLK